MKTIMKLLLMMLIMFSTTALFAQALITDEETPTNINGSAIFELRSEFGTQGFLPPRVEMIKNGGSPIPANDQFVAPADGLIIYNPGGGNDPVDKGLWYYESSANNGLGRWIIYSNQGSVFSNSVDNYAELYERSTDPTGTSYTLTQGTWTAWTTGSYDEVVMGEYFNPLPQGVLSGGPVTSLEVLEDGVYQVTLNGVFYRISNLTLEVSMFVDGTAVDKIYGMAKLASNGDARTVSASGMISLTANQFVEVKFKSDAAGSVGLVNFNFTLYKVGE